MEATRLGLRGSPSSTSHQSLVASRTERSAAQALALTRRHTGPAVDPQADFAMASAKPSATGACGRSSDACRNRDSVVVQAHLTCRRRSVTAATGPSSTRVIERVSVRLLRQSTVGVLQLRSFVLSECERAHFGPLLR